MRYLFLLIVVWGCSNSRSYDSYGQLINAENSLGVYDLISEVDSVESDFKVKGIIDEVCQMKGCWMTLRNDDGLNIRVTFKDYGFFVPKDISGKEVIIEGVALKEVLDEETAKHYAEDGGVEYDESLRNSISFIAHGVLVPKSEQGT